MEGNQEKPEGNNNKDANRRKFPSKSQRPSSSFKGETAAMNGKVFEVQGERIVKKQFKDTLEALERYAGQFYPKDIGMLQPVFKRLEKPILNEPESPSENVKSEDNKTAGAETDLSEWERLKFTERMRMYLRSEERLNTTMIALYNVAWGQCSQKMQDRLESEASFPEIKKNDDLVGLLKLIKIISHQFTINNNLEEGLDEAGFKLMAYRQGEFDTVSDHIQNIKNLYHVIEYYGGSIVNEETLIKAAKKKDKEDGVSGKSEEEYKTKVKNRALALRALKSSKYKAVLNDIRKKYLYREDAYPNDLTEAQELLNHHVVTNKIVEAKPGVKKPKQTAGNGNNLMRGAQYLQDNPGEAPKVPGNDGKVHDVKCYECQSFGHYSANCPNKDTKQEEVQESHFAETVSIGSNNSESEELMLIIILQPS